MTLSFQKLVGAGNDFIFVKNSDYPEKSKRPALAQKLCDRQFGIGADGLVFMEPIESKPNQYVWDFYNSDGSVAEMCGNAARCAVRYCQTQFNQNSCQFETIAGLVSGNLEDVLVRVQWAIKSETLEEIQIELENKKTFSGFFINTGVPHFVIANHEQKISLQDCGLIQSHPQFGAAQTNVTLLDTQSSKINLTKTFERGVQNFTMACGTGVIASAFVLQRLKPCETYFLQVPGGKLMVQLEGKTVHLIGPAELTFNGNIDLD